MRRSPAAASGTATVKLRMRLSVMCALGAAVVLAACGDDEGSASVVLGTGYEYALPDGWTELGDDVADGPRASSD